MNLLRRAQGRFEGGQRSAVSALRQAAMVASDETGVRIEGANAYHWVFRSPEAVVHHAAPTRAAAVVRDMMDGHRPALWLSDRYAAQQGHGVAHQTCLAHLARDIAYAVEASDDPVPWRLQIWLDTVFALAGRVTSLAASTLAAKRRTLDQHLAGILTTASCCDLTRALQAKISRARDQLLTFLDHPGLVAVTNKACERALRPAVVQRKVTNGYRAMWAAEGEAAVRTVIDTARLTSGTPVFGAILTTVSAYSVVREVGTGCGTRERLVPCVELNALRCSGKFTKTSIAFVRATASMAAHGMCMPNGSTKTTAR